MRCARVVVVSVVSGSRAVPSHTYNLSDSIEASAQARSVTPPGGRFCTRSSKGSLAVNTAEKQRAQSISHLRRQVHLKLHMSIYTTITSRVVEIAMASRRAGAPTHIVGNSLELVSL